VADNGYFDPTGCGNYSAIMARRSLIESGKLETPAEMKDRRIAMYTAGASEYLVETILRSAGLTIDDIEIADVPAPAMAEAFGDGSIDLAVISEPWITRIQKTRNATVWMPFSQVFPDFQWVLILFGPSLLDENPNAGRRFMIAYLKAVRQYNDGKTERNIAIISQATKLDEALLRDICWPSFRNDGSINMQSVLDYQAWAVERGYLDIPVTEEQLWDPTFAVYANEVINAPTQ
jgi:NitT/TauT family transport system substrate-binding protein